ncbi:MAG: hypothetical protein ABS76_08605 [Pelagibacterium sp. SCN 64-44]|nr:MAG: hypothetical protein ABS76_08605 [Pelagibacterium sp. SCN 64-44]
MPTLFRLLITLLFLAGLAFAGMFALVTFVEVKPREVTQRIPTRDLLGETGPASSGGGTGLPQPNVTSAPAEPAGQ